MEAHSSVFIAAPESLTLADFCTQAFQALGVGAHEERESSNYLGGEYFRSVEHEPELKVSLADFSQLAGYRFWLFIASSEISAEQYANEAGSILATHGYACFVPSSNWARKSWDGSGTHFEA